MLEVGSRVLIVGTVLKGEEGIIVDIVENRPWGYLVRLLADSKNCLFLQKELIAIPRKATPEQVSVLKDICCR